MTLIIISTLVAIISIAWAISLRSRFREDVKKSNETLAALSVYDGLQKLNPKASEVSYLADLLRERRAQEEERKELCIKRQVGEQRVCRTCGTQLEHWGPAGYYSPEYMGVSCPSCKWSCNIKRILPPNGR